MPSLAIASGARHAVSLTRWNDAIRPIGPSCCQRWTCRRRWPDVLVTAVVGYLLGSIPVADLVAHRRSAVDLRDVGDHNPGYWNAKETLGRRAALPVFIGDVAKGSRRGARRRGARAPGVWGMAYVGTGAAMVGHALPVFARFRGGRSVLTFVGGRGRVRPVPCWSATVCCSWCSR